MPGPTPTNLDIAAYAHQEAVTYAAWLRAGNSTGDLSEHAVEGLEKHFVHVIRHALSVRLGDLADNPPAQTQKLDVDAIAKAIVTAACELDGPSDPEADDTISIKSEDLGAVVHRHVTAALEAHPEWKAMQTAPRDGTVILLCGGAYGGYPFPAKWDLGPFGSTDRPWLNVINDSRLYEHVPKKWMPIPQNPSPNPRMGGIDPVERSEE